MTTYYSLPYPPSVNTYWRSIGRGRVLISKEGRQYREDAISVMREAGATKLNGRLEVHVSLTMPDKRRRDVDNVLKSLLDALQHGGAYDDDSQIDKLTIERGGVEAPGAALVFIREREAAPKQLKRWVLDHCS